MEPVDVAFALLGSAILATDRIDFATMQRLVRFARYWDLIANSGRFAHTLPAILGAAPFANFMALSDWLYATTDATHRGIGGERFTISVVMSKHAEERDSSLMKRRQTERRTVVAGVHHHAHAFGGEPVEETRYSGNTVVGVGHQSNSHYALLQSGRISSLRTRSS